MNVIHTILNFLADGTPVVPTTTPGIGSGTDHTIVNTIITVIGGGILSIIASFVITRGKKVPDPPAPQPEDPDDEYRKLLDKNAAYRLFLARRGYNPDLILTGMERVNDVRS